jgi:hypothetical protein
MSLARRRHRLGEPLAATAIAGAVVAILASEIFAPGGYVELRMPLWLGLTSASIAAGIWFVVLSELGWTDAGRRFLVRSLPVRRATLTAAELPNTLTIAALVLATAVLLPSTPADGVTTAHLFGAFAFLLSSWAAGSSARYRMGALILSEAMFWIGLSLLAIGVLAIADRISAGASLAAGLSCLALCAYSSTIALGFRRTARKWMHRRQRRSSTVNMQT